jgi:hypothetical protein
LEFDLNYREVMTLFIDTDDDDRRHQRSIFVVHCVSCLCLALTLSPSGLTDPFNGGDLQGSGRLAYS